VTLAGRLATPLESPVTLAVKPPAGLGLTRLERQRGMTPLNDEREQEVLLTGEPFEITFQRVP
jgi:hypothetical protein